MPDPAEAEVLRQLAAVRQELRLLRALLIFVSVLLAIVFLLPVLSPLLTARDSELPRYVAPVLGTVVAVLLALIVLSRYAPPRPASQENSDESPVA